MHQLTCKWEVEFDCLHGLTMFKSFTRLFLELLFAESFLAFMVLPNVLLAIGMLQKQEFIFKIFVNILCIGNIGNM